MIGDPAGPELHTHQAHYQGELAVRMALGVDVNPDYRALPRATYTDPEAAFVGLTLEQAKADGIDAVEFVADFATSSRGYAVEASGPRHDHRSTGAAELVGAAMAGPDASAAIHECVLAIQAHVPIEVLADTIHAFPSTSRILNGLFADAAGPRPTTPAASPAASRPQRSNATSPSIITSRGRAVARAPPGSTGSLRAAAGSTMRSARWPRYQAAAIRSAATTAGPTTPPAAPARA